MPRVIQKKKTTKFDFDFILKIFFTLLAAVVLVLVVVKVVERVNNNKVDKIDPLFAYSDFKGEYVKNLYEGGLDEFFADEQLEIPGYNINYPGAIFIFVYNSNTDIYKDMTKEEEEDQNKLKDFITKDFNKENAGDQHFYQLAKDYINKLNSDERKIVLLLDVYGYNNYYGKQIPMTNFTLAENSLAVCQISYHTSDKEEIDKTQTFSFGVDNFGATYTKLNGILGEVNTKYPK